MLLVIHCVLIQAHAAGMGAAHSRHLNPGIWSLKGQEQATWEGGFEQPKIITVTSTLTAFSFQAVFLRHEAFQPTFPYFLKIILFVFNWE